VVTVTKTDAIINPKRSKSAPELGPVVLMVATESDLMLLCELLNLNENSFRKLFISKLYVDTEKIPNIAVVGPFVGAPYAVMLLETLIAWGAEKVLFFGWCGAISDKVKIGDIILPDSAIIDEGTSSHYILNTSLSRPSPLIVAQARNYLHEKDFRFHQGKIWSTDAVFRETRDKVLSFQKQNVLAVDMETSSVFSVAKFRDVDAGGILVVSDELSTLKWRPGFKDKRFDQNRRTACRVVMELCHRMLIQN
jgi:purine-nucleoside phosphorylase